MKFEDKYGILALVAAQHPKNKLINLMPRQLSSVLRQGTVKNALRQTRTHYNHQGR